MIKALEIGNKSHPFTAVRDTLITEFYERKNENVYEMQGRATHRLTVRRKLDTTNSIDIRKRNEQAERERKSRRTLVLDERDLNLKGQKGRSATNGNKLLARSSRSSVQSLSRSNLTTGAKSTPNSPLLRSVKPLGMTNGHGTTVGGGINGRVRSQTTGNDDIKFNVALQPTSLPRPTTRTRLIHMLAVCPVGISDIKRRLRFNDEQDFISVLKDVASEKGRLWYLDSPYYKDIDISSWPSYTTSEKRQVAKKQQDELAKLASQANKSSGTPEDIVDTALSEANRNIKVEEEFIPERKWDDDVKSVSSSEHKSCKDDISEMDIDEKVDQQDLKNDVIAIGQIPMQTDIDRSVHYSNKPKKSSPLSILEPKIAGDHGMEESRMESLDINGDQEEQLYALARDFKSQFQVYRCLYHELQDQLTQEGYNPKFGLTPPKPYGDGDNQNLSKKVRDQLEQLWSLHKKLGGWKKKLQDGVTMIRRPA